jgi:hypothetical protein
LLAAVVVVKIWVAAVAAAALSLKMLHLTLGAHIK